MFPKDIQYYIQDMVDQETKYTSLITNLKRDIKKYYAHFEYIPENIVVRLFVHGIYNKFLCSPSPTTMRAHLIGNPGRSSRSAVSVLADPGLNTHLTVLLDTVYYGYSLSPSASEQPNYRFGNLSSGSFVATYVPCQGHDSLTSSISPTDLMQLVLSLAHFGDKFDHSSSGYKTTASKEFIQKRDKIIYEFLVLLQHLGNKYRARHAIQQKEAAKLKAIEQAEKLAAALNKQRAAEARKAEKLAAKEAKRHAAIEKQRAAEARKTAKLAATEAKINAALEKLRAAEARKAEQLAAKEAKRNAALEKQRTAEARKAAKLAVIIKHTKNAKHTKKDPTPLPL
jgi:hypothetical protein